MNNYSLLGILYYAARRKRSYRLLSLIISAGLLSAISFSDLEAQVVIEERIEIKHPGRMTFKDRLTITDISSMEKIIDITRGDKAEEAAQKLSPMDQPDMWGDDSGLQIYVRYRTMQEGNSEEYPNFMIFPYKTYRENQYGERETSPNHPFQLSASFRPGSGSAEVPEYLPQSETGMFGIYYPGEEINGELNLYFTGDYGYGEVTTSTDPDGWAYIAYISMEYDGIVDFEMINLKEDDESVFTGGGTIIVLHEDEKLGIEAEPKRIESGESSRLTVRRVDGAGDYAQYNRAYNSVTVEISEGAEYGNLYGFGQTGEKIVIPITSGSAPSVMFY